MDIYPNAYYNYLKHRKADYYAQKETVLEEIRNIYHDHNGVDGYRSMRVYLERKNICLSALTVHKYMNKELGLQAIVRRKKPDYRKGKTHKVFDNLIKQNFRAEHINQKWATDFTYLFLPGGETRYNCTVIDLYDRSVVASITDRSITSDLAIRTVRKAMDSQTGTLKGIILHSDYAEEKTMPKFFFVAQTSSIMKDSSA